MEPKGEYSDIKMPMFLEETTEFLPKESLRSRIYEALMESSLFYSFTNHAFGAMEVNSDTISVHFISL